MNKRKKKKIIIYSSVLAFLVVASTSITVGVVVSNNNNKKSVFEKEEEVIPNINLPYSTNTIIQEDYSEPNVTTPIENIGNTKAEITERYDRNVATKFYETDLQKQYPSLEYPGWNNNYRDYDTTLGGTFKPTTMDVFDGNKTNSFKVKNVSEAVWAETINWNGIKYRYSDPEFIRSEIMFGELKKHPAAKNRYQYDVTDDTKAVKKVFSIPSTVKGITSLGLYAPAGEIMELKFSKETLDLMKAQNIENFRIIINDSYWNVPENDEFNNGTGKIANRYPFLESDFKVNLWEIDSDGTYKFGTPFGGSISIFIDSSLKQPNSNDWYPSYHNYEFEVKNAVESIYYSHGVTTKEQWDDMIDRYVNQDGNPNKITAPNLSLDFAYGSMNISSHLSEKNTFAKTPINSIVYPESTLEKWTGFLFCSEYFGGRDVYKNVRKLDFRFCDYVWGGAAAWGGGNRLSSPMSWASNSFLTGADNWTIKNNWGTFHEINHNFQQNDAIWQLNTHGETNQVTIPAFSLLGDNGRWRNKLNWTAEYDQQYSPSQWAWFRFQNMFSIIEFLKDLRNQNKTTFEYDIYGLINFFGGSYNYMNYVRNDIQTNNGKDPVDNTNREGGFYEILELSNFYNLNFWPALNNFYPLWHDNKDGWSSLHKWPQSYKSATPVQKALINDLKKYKSFDFVGNLYSCGSYLWNDEKNDFIYTGDTNSPYQIPAGKSYVLDFESGINSLNKDFKWDNISFPSTTSAGGTLKVDPNNSKKLIYTPNKNAIDQIDEFDISINISNQYKKPDNYVPCYKWKIKIRQTPDAALQTLYTGWDNSIKYNASNFVNDMKALRDNRNPTTYKNLKVLYQNVHNPVTSSGVFNDSTILNKDDIKGTLSEFYFVAPEDGQYEFQIKNAIDLVIEVDDAEVYRGQQVSGDWKTAFTKNLQKGQKIKVSNYLMYKNNPLLNYHVLKDGEVIDFSKNVLNNTALELNSSNPEVFLTDKYTYKSRRIDYNNFQTSMFGLNVSREKTLINKNEYDFSSDDPQVKDQYKYLKDDDDKYLEIWTAPKVDEITLTLNAEFKQPTNVRTIFFNHRTNNHWELRPTKIKIENENDEVLFDGDYGSQKNDRSKDSSVLTLDKNYTVNKLKFTFYNNQTKDIWGNGDYKTGIIFDSIFFSSQHQLQANKSIPINSSTIKQIGNWELLNNSSSSSENISPINQTSLKSITPNDSLEFNLTAEGFDLVGKLNNTNFDVFINGKKYEQQLNPSNEEFSQILFQYTSNTKKEYMKIKIVNRSTNPLYIDYIQTYGEYVKNY